MKKTKWASDLRAVRDGSLQFRAFAIKHEGIIGRIAGPWVNRGGSFAGHDDLKQEALIEIWRAIVEWEPARTVPLDSYVRLRVRNRLLAMTHRIVKGRELETRSMFEGNSGNRISGGSSLGGPMVALEHSGVGEHETEITLRNKAARVVGALSGADAALVAAVINGASLDVAARKAYGRVLGVRESKRRAVDAAAAAALIAAID